MKSADDIDLYGVLRKATEKLEKLNFTKECIATDVILYAEW